MIGFGGVVITKEEFDKMSGEERNYFLNGN